MGDNLAILIGPTLVSLALYVWVAASLHAVFRKAGEESWQAWVPVLNIVVLLRLGGLSGWWALLLLVPGLGAVALAVVVWIACHRINASFGAGAGMTVLAILVFPVWSSILGWGSARWIGREQLGVRPARSEAAVRPDPVDNALHHVPPRPPSLPAVSPPAWPAAAASSAPAAAGPPLVSHVPSAARPVDDSGDDDYPPRRRVSAFVAEEHAGGAVDAADPPPPASGRGGHAAPYTGTLPTFIDPEPRLVPAGPRRAVVPAPDDESDDHLVHSHDASVLGMAPTPSPLAGRDPWAPPVDEPPARPHHYLPPPGDPGFPETTGEVSAVAGAPALGDPMPARSSVSAQREEPELPETESAFDDTIVGKRRRTAWMLTPPLGAPIPVTSDVLIIGRRPSSDPAFPKAQLVPVADETRTMSKTHARLEMNGDGWTIVDLDSTNGVLLLRPDGSEFDLVSGRPEPVTESFLLGDAEVRLTREPGVE